MTDLIEVPRGLKGVAAAETRIGDVRGVERCDALRLDDAEALDARRALEEAWFLRGTGESRRRPSARSSSQPGAGTGPGVLEKAFQTARAHGEDGAGGRRGARAARDRQGDSEAWTPSCRRSNRRARRRPGRSLLVGAAVPAGHGEQPIPPHAGLGHAANNLGGHADDEWRCRRRGARGIPARARRLVNDDDPRPSTRESMRAMQHRQGIARANRPRGGVWTCDDRRRGSGGARAMRRLG